MAINVLPPGDWFHRLFEEEPQRAAPAFVSCPAPLARFYNSRTAIANLNLLARNRGYGCTGLLSVEDVSIGRETLPRGAIFLFPGRQGVLDPFWNGPLPEIFGPGSAHEPLTLGPSYQPLHAQLCALLNAPTTAFIGFSVASDLTFGWNSSTCNPEWFDDSRTIPANPCNGTDWRQGISETIREASDMSNLVATFAPVSWYCDDIHSGAKADASFGFPTTGDWFYLGQVAVAQHQGFTSFSSMVVREVGPVVNKPKIKAPDFMVRKWEKTGYGGMCVVSYGCNDPDYVALGDLYVRDYASNVKPSNFPQLVCVRRDQLMAATYQPPTVWTDQGSGAQDNVSLWSVRDSNLVWYGDSQPSGFLFKAISSYPDSRTAAFKLLAPLTLDPAKVTMEIAYDENGTPVTGDEF
jgi:hypothetical protein